MSQEIMKIYHGSQYIIEVPVYGKGNKRNDYGLGFYTSASREMAFEWACAKGTHGFANEYQIDLNDMDILRLTGEGYHLLNWLAVLLDNRTFRISSDLALEGRKYILRHFLPDYKKRDVIIGYRADDSYFSFANAFLNNGIGLEQLGRAMRLGKLGEQIAIKSKKAFDRLCFVRSHAADQAVYYPQARNRDLEARRQFQTIKAKAGSRDQVYLIDILRQQWDNDDERLQAFLAETES